MPGATSYFGFGPDESRQKLPFEHMRHWPTAPKTATVYPPDGEDVPALPAADTADVLPKNQGAFLSALNYLGRFGQVPKNLLTGNFEGAGRQTLDILGDTLDASLPGDWIPEASRSQDYVTGTDVLGVDKAWQQEHPFLNTLASLPVDVATDPLTWIGLGPIAKGVGIAGKGIEQVAKMLPKGAEAVAALKSGAATAGKNLRSIAGAQRLTPEASGAMAASAAAKGNEAQAGLSAIKSSPALSGLVGDEANVVGDIVDNFKWDGDKLLGELSPGSASALDRIAAHPGVNPGNIDRITKAVQDTIDIGQNQAQRPGIFTLETLPKEYLARGYKGQTEEQAINEVLGAGPEGLGAPGAGKARTLLDAEAVAGHLEKNPGVKYERNAIARLAQRAQAQGTLAGRAEIGRKLLGDAFTLTDDTQRSALTEKLRVMASSADPIEQESAKVLHDAFHGLSPRGPITDMLAKVNRVVKPMMVYGYAIPKFGSIVRNKISGIWQAASNPGGRGVALKQAQRFGTDLRGAVADSLGIKAGSGNLGRALGLVEDAFKQSGGAAENASNFLKQSAGAGGYTGAELASMVDSGALSGFVSSEDLIKSMAASPKAKAWKSVTEWPARMFKGVEDRMRGGMYLDLIRKNKAPAEAAKIVSDSMFDYSVSSAGNRAARDVLPFGQFMFKAIPQQGKFLAEKPAVAVALSSLLTEKEGQTTYPWMDGKLNVPLGTNEQGNQDYASGFGLPFETLGMIPNPSDSLHNFSRDIGRSLVGSSQPLLKTAGSLAFGQDPMFGTPFGTYSKLPGNIEGGSVGRAYNVVNGTGLIQPIDAPLRLIGKITDDRKSAAVKALDILTGANVVSVDPDRALQQRLTEYLRANPDVSSVESLYSKSKDPQALRLIKELQAAKKRSAAKRKAAD